MNGERHNLRVNCYSHSLLMGLDGVAYRVKLADLSLGGAMVEMGEDIVHGLHVGEMCGLMLCDDITYHQTKHTGMIVRLETGSVGISFHHQEHAHQKKKFTTPV